MAKGNKKKKTPPFAAAEYNTMWSEVWQRLTHAEMIAYMYLKVNLPIYGNGRIRLTYSSMKGVMGPATLKKAFDGLQEKGWIEKTEEGGRMGCPCLYRLTWKYDYPRFEYGLQK